MGDYRSHGRRLDDHDIELRELREFKERAEKLFEIIGRWVKCELELDKREKRKKK